MPAEGSINNKPRPGQWKGLICYKNMVITVNGSPAELKADTPLDQFLRDRSQDAGSVVVERNGEIIARDRRHLVMLRDGDVLEIVKLVGGG
jgi:thiamine biosynthesis protein ThiS